MQIIDISVPISASLATWDNAETAIEREWLGTIANGESCNLSRITIGSHVGTHLDAPLHFIDGGNTVDNLDLSSLIGPCCVVEVCSDEIRNITADDCASAFMPANTERVLFKTSNSSRSLMRDPKFHEDFVAIAPDGAQWLVDHRVRVVGVDYLSVGSPSDGTIEETHRILLGNGIVALEGLMLEDVKPGAYQLIALPLKIVGAEGCPIRAVLIPNEPMMVRR